jgi:hypothetical protein
LFRNSSYKANFAERDSGKETNFSIKLKEKKKMKTNSKRKLLFTMLFLTILVVSSTYAVRIPEAQAAEKTIREKGLEVLNNVVGIDLARFNVTSKEYSQDAQSSYMGVVPQQCLDYTVTSGESTQKWFYTFADGNLQMIQLSNEGVASQLTKPSTRFNAFAAKSFLIKYQAYTNDSLFGELCATLDGVDAGSDVTKTVGDTRLEVTTSDDGCTNFKWYYTANGAVAPYSKFVVLEFKDGLLKTFVNNWQLYGVGSTTVRLSKEDAVAIALNTAKAHSWSVNLDVDALEEKNFNASNVCWASLIFDGSVNANKTRNEDPLMLYPVWRVGISLNKWYGYMYGIQVDVWADTGEVRSVQEAWSTILPSEGVPTADLAESTSVSEANLSLPVMVALTTALAIIGASFFWMSRQKSLSFDVRRKLFSKKIAGVLFCVLLLSVVFLSQAATVNATTRGAAVWGSQSDGAVTYPAGDRWRKSQDEIDCQQANCSTIASYFANNGYTGNGAINHQGTDAGQILSDIANLNSGKDYMAVVDFDHGVGGVPTNAPPDEYHYMFEDNTGTIIGGPAASPTPYPEGHYTDYNHGVFDMTIHQLVQERKVIFALINTCMSANTTLYGQGLKDDNWNPHPRAFGMPFAWTHRTVANRNTAGFTIAQNISDDGYNNPDWGFQVYIGFTYGSASLSQNIPYDEGYPYNNWVVSFFDNALNHYKSVNDALDSASSQYFGSSFGTSDLQDFTAYWWNPDGGATQDGCKMAVYGNGNIQLKQFTPPADTPGTPSISGPTTGNPSTSYQFSAFAGDPYAHPVQYRFDWGDGTPYTTTYPQPDGVSANANHSWSSNGLYGVRVQARCAYSDWGSWSSPIYINIGNLTAQLSVYAYNQYGYPGYVPLYIDDNYVGTTGSTYTVLLGNRKIYVESPLYDGNYWHVFDHYVYGGYSHYANPLTIAVTGSTTLTAYYYSYY